MLYRSWSSPESLACSAAIDRARFSKIGVTPLAEERTLVESAMDHKREGKANDQ